MEVTIINNGTVRIVLKPKTQAEILAVKEMQGKVLSSKHHESTQILGESFPNCLVIQPQGEPVEDIKWIGVYDSHQQNRCIGLIPTNSTKSDILNFIRTRSDMSETIHLVDADEIVPQTTFKVYDGDVEGEYFIDNVEFYI